MHSLKVKHCKAQQRQLNCFAFEIPFEVRNLIQILDMQLKCIWQMIVCYKPTAHLYWTKCNSNVCMYVLVDKCLLKITCSSIYSWTWKSNFKLMMAYGIHMLMNIHMYAYAYLVSVRSFKVASSVAYKTPWTKTWFE